MIPVPIAVLRFVVTGLFRRLFPIKAGHDVPHDGRVIGDALEAVPADDRIGAQARLAAIAAVGTDASQLQPLGMDHVGVALVT